MTSALSPAEIQQQKDEMLEAVKGKRVFLSKAYLQPLEPGIFGLFRNLMVEEVSGQPEKLGKALGPIRVLRARRPDDPDEAVVLQTFDAASGQVVYLVEAQDG